MKKVVPIYPWPPHAKVTDALATRDDIIPVEALPGGPGPVVAIRKTPHFVCDAILVERPEALLPAVDIAIGNGLSMVTVRDMVAEALGGVEVVEKMERRR